MTVKRRKPNATGSTPSDVQQRIDRAARLRAMSARVLESVDLENPLDAIAKLREAHDLQDALADTLGQLIAKQDRATGAGRTNAAKRARHQEIRARYAELCAAGKARSAASIIAKEFKPLSASQVRRIIATKK